MKQYPPTGTVANGRPEQRGDPVMNETNETVIQEAIHRVRKMEQLFDEVVEAVQYAPEKLHTQTIRDAIQTLMNYDETGEWLHDYELDEQHLLPSELKRGVLSQDGLYDLFCTLRDGYFTEQERTDSR